MTEADSRVGMVRRSIVASGLLLAAAQIASPLPFAPARADASPIASTTR